MSEDQAPRTILLPLDLTPAGEVKIPVAEEYARCLSANVLLVHVLRPGSLDPASVQRTEAVARTYLDTVAARLRGAGIDAEGVIRTGAPGATIVEEAMLRNISLIVLGSNVRPTLQTAVLGSVADQVIRSAPCPVLLVHPRGDARPRTDLRSFHQDADRAGVLVRRSLGLRTIELARIVGSVDRYKELGPDFRPLKRRGRKGDEDRYRHMREAIDAGKEMPPIEVYKLGFGYYLVDGHHRVAAALANGQLEIDAHVIEYLPAGDEQYPERFAARRAFEQATGLTEVGAQRADSYATLLDEIEKFREQQKMDELPRAARRWFIEVFRPLWEQVRAQQLAARFFPGDRPADVIARLAAWRNVDAPDTPWEVALERFVEAQESEGASTSSSRNG
ncbi:MAG: universal stress protein [Chloroflexi bacterium]|nr:universal stress protein [Chloroflexota bacterium]